MRGFSFSRCETGGGAPRRFGGSAGPTGRLPCGARGRGPAVELASRPSAAALRQRRRVGSRSALRARAPTPALLGDPQARRNAPPRASRGTPTRTNSPTSQRSGQPRPNAGARPGARTGIRPGTRGGSPRSFAAAGAWGRGLWGRREAQRPGWRAQRASQTDPPSLSERSALRAPSEFDGATRPRASQRSRPYGRPPPPAPPPGPRCREANANTPSRQGTENRPSHLS